MPQLSAYPEHADRIAAKLKEVQDMKLDQFFAFADGPDDHVRQVGLTRASARELAMEIRREINTAAKDEGELFEIRTADRPGEVMFQFARLARMAAEDQAAGPPLSPAGRATGEVVGGA